MRKGPLVVTLSLSLMVGVALAPTVASAAGGHRGGIGGGTVSGGRPSGTHHHGFKGHHGHHHGFKGHHGSAHGFKGHHGFRPFFPWGVVTTWVPPFYYGSTAPSYYPPPAYYAPNYTPPAVYGPPAGASISVAPAPPTPGVVYYPNGRYEIRGDGITMPYTWVWIPNPPPPPSEPPATAPGSPGGPPGEQPTSGNGPPERHRQLYRWTDEQGVTHWTNRPDAVPTKDRTQAKHAPPS